MIEKRAKNLAIANRSRSAEFVT